MNHKRYQIGGIILVFILSVLCLRVSVKAEANTTRTEQTTTKKGLAFEEEYTEDEGWHSLDDTISWTDIPGFEETTTQEQESETTEFIPDCTGEYEVTTKTEPTSSRAPAEAITKPTKGSSDAIETSAVAVKRTVMTIVKLSKVSKKKAKLYVFAEGKYKSKNLQSVEKNEKELLLYTEKEISNIKKKKLSCICKSILLQQKEKEDRKL